MINKRLFSLLVTAGFLSMSGAAFADSTDATVQNTQQELNQMSSQINSLNKEIKLLKTEQKSLQQQQRITAVHVNNPQARPLVIAPVAPNSVAPIPANAGAPGKSPALSYLSGTPVVIAPYVGDHVAFNGSDLIVNYSGYNEDLHLLQLRQSVYNQFQQLNCPTPVGPMLMLSGQVEGVGIYSNPSEGDHTSKFDLSAAELDLIPTLNDWASGFIAMKYDNSQIPNAPLSANSRVFVDRAFLTVGNLNQLPLYMSIGQMYVPFGTYSSNMISATLPQLIFQTKERALLLGYSSANGQGLYGSIYGFNGDADTHHSNNINDAGANLGFIFSNNTSNVDVGVGAITDVADSLGMQTTSAVSTSAMPNFTGFSNTTSLFTNQENELQHQVAGVATHLNFGIGNFGVNSEYIKAAEQFSPLDMSYNGHGARPQALYAEAYYNFPVFDKPSAFTVGYGRTWQALALAVPQQRYIAAFTTSIWRDTTEELEFRHDKNYSCDDNASAFGIMIPGSALDGSSNTVTAQIGLFF
jgi:hypothetical protein